MLRHGNRHSLWKTLVIAGIGIAAVVAIGCTPETSVTVTPAEAAGIAATGTGSVTVVPDVALLNLGVEVTRPTVGEARTAANESMESIRASLDGNGIAAGDIKTQFFNIYPQYAHREGEAPVITGFTVSNQVEVKVREIDIDQVSVVLDGAIDAGGDSVRVNNVGFTVDEPEQFFDQAREQAVADARARAEQLADLAGVELGDVRSISESSFGFPPQRPFALEAAAAGGDTSISPGEAEVSLQVNVVFAIK